MNQRQRLFIAVPIPASILRSLHDVLEPLERTSTGLRWIPSRNLHVTLNFLGEVPSRRVPAIIESLDALAAASQPFHLLLKGLGGFPTLRQLRVLWIGVEGETPALVDLQSGLATRLETLGFDGDARLFHPHLTIARSRQPLDGRHWNDPRSALAQWTSDLFHVDHPCLFASVLKPTGAEYQCLHRANLAG